MLPWSLCWDESINTKVFFCQQNSCHQGTVYLKASSHDAISCTQLLSNSLIRELSLWFQRNSMIQITSCEPALRIRFFCYLQLIKSIIKVEIILSLHRYKLAYTPFYTVTVPLEGLIRLLAQTCLASFCLYIRLYTNLSE